jgi:hypothetical protein
MVCLVNTHKIVDYKATVLPLSHGGTGRNNSYKFTASMRTYTIIQDIRAKSKPLFSYGQGNRLRKECSKKGKK